MSTIIKPTVGRHVHFWPAPIDGLSRMSSSNGDQQPLAAIITAVWDDGCVNLAVFGADGTAGGRTAVTLVQPGAPRPDGLACCEWPAPPAPEPAPMAPPAPSPETLLGAAATQVEQPQDAVANSAPADQAGALPSDAILAAPVDADPSNPDGTAVVTA